MSVRTLVAIDSASSRYCQYGDHTVWPLTDLTQAELIAGQKNFFSIESCFPPDLREKRHSAVESLIFAIDKFISRINSHHSGLKIDCHQFWIVYHFSRFVTFEFITEKISESFDVLLLPENYAKEKRYSGCDLIEFHISLMEYIVRSKRISVLYYMPEEINSTFKISKYIKIRWYWNLGFSGVTRALMRLILRTYSNHMSLIDRFASSKLGVVLLKPSYSFYNYIDIFCFRKKFIFNSDSVKNSKSGFNVGCDIPAWSDFSFSTWPLDCTAKNVLNVVGDLIFDVLLGRKAERFCLSDQLRSFLLDRASKVIIFHGAQTAVERFFVEEVSRMGVPIYEFGHSGIDYSLKAGILFSALEGDALESKTVILAHEDEIFLRNEKGWSGKCVVAGYPFQLKRGGRFKAWLMVTPVNELMNEREPEIAFSSNSILYDLLISESETSFGDGFEVRFHPMNTSGFVHFVANALEQRHVGMGFSSGGTFEDALLANDIMVFDMLSSKVFSFALRAPVHRLVRKSALYSLSDFGRQFVSRHCIIFDSLGDLDSIICEIRSSSKRAAPADGLPFNSRAQSAAFLKRVFFENAG